MTQQQNTSTYSTWSIQKRVNPFNLVNLVNPSTVCHQPTKSEGNKSSPTTQHATLNTGHRTENLSTENQHMPRGISKITRVHKRRPGIVAHSGLVTIYPR